MSQVYATEPATSGRVIFNTTHGPLEIQLWCQECPATTKFFLQLCVDGFYDNMVFHRVVPKLLIQTGSIRQLQPDNSISATTSSSDFTKAYRSAVEADQALDRRRYELQSRIRFNHRGQVAMALEVTGQDDLEDLQPQFFITLEDAPYLDGKHVIFGTITGPTFFNADRIGKFEVDESTYQPIDLKHAPRINSVKVVDNPIHNNLTAQAQVPWRPKDTPKDRPKKKKRKGKFNMNVLSFGDEMDVEPSAANAVVGVKSSHDVLEHKSLSKHVDEKVVDAAQSCPSESKSMSISEKNTQQVNPKLVAMDSMQNTSKKNGNEEPGKTLAPTEKECALVQNDEPPRPKREKQKIKKSANNVSKPESAVEARRAKYLSKRQKNKKEREEKTLSKLFDFQKKVRSGLDGKSSINSVGDGNDNSLASRMARRLQQSEELSKHKNMSGPSYHGQLLESDHEDDDNDWMQTRFKCKRHMDHYARDKVEVGGDGRDADDYKVIDEKVNRYQSGDHDSNHSQHRRKSRENQNGSRSRDKGYSAQHRHPSKRHRNH